MTVGEWLDGLDDPGASAPVGADDLAAIRRELEDAAAHAAAVLAEHGAGPGGAAPADGAALRVPKGRLSAMGQCERRALADWADDDAGRAGGENVVKGIALDHFVAHQLVAGRVTDPVGDLAVMLSCWGDDDAVAALDALDADRGEALLAPLATEVAQRWADVAAGWAPRTQRRAVVSLDDGRCVTSGLVDVELGGGDTGRPSVVVEVKSGTATHAHQSEVYLYALLVALRDRAAPAVVARWYPGADPVGVPVGVGLLDSAARRLGDGIVRWAELLSGSGDPPTVVPGPWCGWCPDTTCTSRLDPGSGDDGGGDV